MAPDPRVLLYFCSGLQQSGGVNLSYYLVKKENYFEASKIHQTLLHISLANSILNYLLALTKSFQLLYTIS